MSRRVAVVMKRVVIVLISSVLLCIVQAQSDAVASSSGPQEKAAHTAGSSSEKTTTAPQPTGEPLIAAGVLIKVSVFEAPDLDREVRVSADGMISLPLIGEVHVAGLSTEQVRELLEKTLIEKGLMRHPQVSVMEKDYATQGVAGLCWLGCGALHECAVQQIDIKLLPDKPRPLTELLSRPQQANQPPEVKLLPDRPFPLVNIFDAPRRPPTWVLDDPRYNPPLPAPNTPQYWEMRDRLRHMPGQLHIRRIPDTGPPADFRRG